jgi:hypothetical protein
MKNQGSCHCGAVTFEFNGEVKEGLSCNCSHCDIKGAVLHFLPKQEVAILSGKDNLTTYTFNKHAIKHQFCNVCGVQPFGFADSPNGEMAAINLRTVPSINIEGITINKYNGKAL